MINRQKEERTMTLRELRALLPSTDGVEMPSEPWFREHPDEIRFEADIDGSCIRVYTNGFFTFSEDGWEHMTILRTDGFSQLTYTFADDEVIVVPETEFLDSSYLVALFAVGQEAWQRKAQRRIDYYEDDCADLLMGSDTGGLISESAGDTVLGRFNEHRQEATMRRAWKTLTPRQREIAELYYHEKLTQEEIAEQIGVSQQSVLDVLNSATKKIFAGAKKVPVF